MEVITKVLSWIIGLPSPVLMFFIFLILNLILRMKLARAIRSAFMYAIGLFALSTFAFDVFLGTVSGAASAMIENTGLSMTAVDYGIGVSPIIMSNPINLLAIPVGIITNIIFLLLRWTKTLDVDIWNILYFMGATGVLTYAATDNTLYAILAMVISMIITLKFADWSAKHIHKALPKFEGLSFPYVYSVFYTPLALLFNKLFDLVPFIRNSKLSAKEIREKIGIFGEPGVIGFVIGILIALLAKYNFANIMLTGVKIGAAMHFIPIAMSILIEGLSETTQVISEWATNKFSGRDIFIGMDGVLAAAEPEALAVGAFMVPIALLVSVILPGNQVLPLGMLSVGFILIGLSMPFFNMNILKGILFSIFVIAIELLIGTLMAPYYTQLASAAGLEFPYGATQITNACCATNLLNVKLFELVKLRFGR